MKLNEILLKNIQEANWKFFLSTDGHYTLYGGTCIYDEVAFNFDDIQSMHDFAVTYNMSTYKGYDKIANKWPNKWSKYIKNPS